METVTIEHNSYDEVEQTTFDLDKIKRIERDDGLLTIAWSSGGHSDYRDAVVKEVNLD